MISLGSEISFTPRAWKEGALGMRELRSRRVTGHVIYINKAHGFCRVEYESKNIFGRSRGHECFKLLPGGEPCVE